MQVVEALNCQEIPFRYIIRQLCPDAPAVCRTEPQNFDAIEFKK
jgi:hypothetical protein